MNGREFIRALRKWARKNGHEITVHAARGKGGHQMVDCTSGGRTTVKSGEISKPLKDKMLEQLKLPPEAF